MNRFIVLLSALFSTAALAGDWTHYGAKFTQEGEPVLATALLEDPSSFAGKTILVEGRVADVCQKKGCWLVIAEGDKSMRVLAKDHDFGVAKDSKGETMRMEGVVNAKEIDPETVAHFEEEASEGAVIPEKNVKSNMTYEFVASGIALLRSGK